MKKAMRLAAGLAVTCFSLPARAEPDVKFTFHGFHFTTASVSDAGKKAELRKAAEAQVAIVEGVGLTPETLNYLRGFSIALSEGPGGGHFASAGIELNLPVNADDRPILLHEEMHAYHYGRLPGGFRNSVVRGYYDQAQKTGTWPSGSYMLTNPAEFFAMTTSVELYGHAARPPFTRAALEQKQPEYATWIKKNVK